MRRFPRRLVCAAAFALLALPACGHKQKPAAAHDKILLIGLDGAEWGLIDPMVQAGELPNLARLIAQGAHGKLRSLEPLAKSPAIWTTIATGKSPKEHGIYSFVDEAGGAPLTQNQRAVRAVWNIFTGIGRSVGVVGWLMTWPAEEVNGFVVSDYLQYSAQGARVDGRTYPPALEPEIAPFVVDWEKTPWAFVQRFLDAPLDTLHLEPETERLLLPIKWISAGDVTFARIATDLYGKRRPDFFAVYLRGMDAMGHLYWNYMQPDSVPPHTLSPAGLRLVTGAERRYYRYVDAMLGPILALADENTTILVVSDHGFRGVGRGVEAHRLDGILIVAGKNAGRGEVTGASVYDITPTLLALMGIPPAEDMRGKVLWPALDATIPRDRFQRRIATYETGKRPGSRAPLASAVDKELKDRLRSLGYLDD